MLEQLEKTRSQFQLQRLKTGVALTRTHALDEQTRAMSPRRSRRPWPTSWWRIARRGAQTALELCRAGARRKFACAPARCRASRVNSACSTGDGVLHDNGAMIGWQGAWPETPRLLGTSTGFTSGRVGLASLAKRLRRLSLTDSALLPDELEDVLCAPHQQRPIKLAGKSSPLESEQH